MVHLLTCNLHVPAQDWMRDIAMLGLTVTPTGEFQGATTAAERESMLATCYRAADEGPGAILPQISPRPISACMGIELPDSRIPFSRHPTFQALARRRSRSGARRRRRKRR